MQQKPTKIQHNIKNRRFGISNILSNIFIHGTWRKMYVGMVNAWRTMYVGMVNAGWYMENDVCWYGECWVVHGERCLLVW